jgi:DNA modification methylase
VKASDINSQLFPFQRDVVRWALGKGKAALFADCGLGKTPMQLEWARHVHRQTGGNVLIIAPLAVAQQTATEGAKFGVEVTICREASEIQPGINVTNYEMLHKFSPEAFVGLVLDESSILKAYGGTYRKQLTEFAERIPYRLACTATPAPNDLIEVINHAEFLGVMRGKEMIALFFTQDGNTTHAWRLKGHAKRDFWSWMATWCVAIRKPSDLGYDDGRFTLPELRIHQETVEVTPDNLTTLFPMEATTLQERLKARRESIGDRVARCADLVSGSEEPWIIWCNLNRESEMLTRAIPGAVEVTGSDSPEAKEKAMLDFTAGRIRVLVTKPSIAGFGMNWQHCAKVAFVGLSDSWEQYYQAVRRCWRFGQTRAVDVYLITAETEGAVVANINRKEREAASMFEEIVDHMAGLQLGETTRQEMDYQEDTVTGPAWTLHLGDSIRAIDKVETESVGFSIFSPPFPGMYAYTNSVHDIGNCEHIEQMISHFRFLVGPDKLLRVLKAGRICAIHLTQLTAMLSRDGYIGIKDYRGRVINMMEEAGWIYHGEATIDKNPQVQAVRNKERGLLFKTLATDSSHMRMALADYLIYFRKPGTNQDPIPAGMSPKYNPEGGWITEEEWIEWASPVWYRQTQDYPGGIRETDVLNVRQARESDDERHLCPLQLGVIERGVKLWSNPGDLVLSPFAGIGSEGYQSVLLGRRFVGIELKASYWRVAQENLWDAYRKANNQMTLFDLIEQKQEGA